MEQNINLLNALPTKIKPFISATQNLLVVAAWIVLLLVVYAFSAISLHKNQKKLIELNATKQSATAEMTSLNEQIRKFSFQITGIGAVQLPPNAIFSYYLGTLAKLTPEGVSLEGFTFSIPDKVVTLTGKTYSMQLLSTYLNEINGKHALGNQQLTTIKIQRSEGNIVDFTLSNVMGTR